MCSKILKPPLPKGYGEEGKNKSRAPAAGGGMDDLRSKCDSNHESDWRMGVKTRS